MDWQEFKQKVRAVLWPMNDELNIKYLDDMITYSVYEVDFKYTLEEFNELKQKARTFSFDGLSIISKSSCEVLLKALNNRSFGMSRLLEQGVVSDERVGITLEVYKASDLMVYNILSIIDVKSYKWAHYEPLFDFPEKKTLRLFNLLRIFLNWPYAITLKHNAFLSKERILDYVNSFLFNAAYNFEYYIRICDELEDILGPSIAGKITKLRSDKVYVPTLIYNEYLISKYNLAGATKDPMIQFISYYHIMEYFFNKLYDEDLRETISLALNEAGIVLDNDESLDLILKKIKSKYNVGKGGREIDKLKLCLKNYVFRQKLIKSIELNNKELLKHYKNTEVPFSKGDMVDFYETDEDKFLNSLRNRIYKTRNAIVHSKASDIEDVEGVYSAFDDEKYLVKEIPLMKAIAEEIIINTAEVL